MKYIFLALLSLTGLFFIGCSSAPEAAAPEKEYPVSPEAEAKYQDAEKEMAGNNYNAARGLLNEALELTKNRGQREKISFLVGESLFRAEYYNNAYKWFQKFLLEFPKTERLNDVINRELEIGFKFINGAKRSLWGFYIVPSYDLGVKIVRETLKSYPYTEHSEEYHFMLAGHLFGLEYYDEARTEYESFIRVYPKSKLVPEAEYRMARCYVLMYLGYAYEVTPLAEAYKITGKFTEKYPDSPLNADVKKLHEQITGSFAQRDYEVAMFYARTDKPKSARIYLESVIKNYPETKWAKDAAAALSELPDKEQK
ncbi:MAG: outer membrane protein assembly factor BamD [Planctomycetes bacterium]|nr:outer membrane protein assembly factor BamD [Planctomycetota bacterium]